MEPQALKEAIKIPRKDEIALNNFKESINNISLQSPQGNPKGTNSKYYEILYETLLQKANKQEEDIKYCGKHSIT